jgi:hypothetical protein
VVREFGEHSRIGREDASALEGQLRSVTIAGRDRRARSAQLLVGVAGLAGMAVSLARNVERSRQAWLSDPLPAPCWAWLSNDVPACRGLAVAWLKRGARAPL